jgi:hypothetical protein
MEHWKDATHWTIYGEDVSDVARYLEANPSHWPSNQARDKGYGSSWDLGADWQTCLRMAREGWSEGAERLHASLAVLMPPNDKETETRYDVAGHFPDVARYVAGDPAHMIRRGRTHGHPPVVNIVVAATASGGVPAQSYANFGAAMTNVIDRIEAGGRRVELHVMFPNQLRGRRVLAGWKVKAAEDHCDLAQIAFAIGHPAAYRRFGFGLWEQTDREDYPGMGYGRCVPFTKADAEHMHMEECIIINAEGGKLFACSTPDAALKWVAETLNSTAVETLVELEQ